jgi:hypothetical protein
VGFGARGATTPTAHAETTDVVVVACENIASLVDGISTDAITNADVQAVCGGDGTTNATGFGTALPPTAAAGVPSVANLANALGDEDGVLEASDFRGEFDENWDNNQISTDCHFGGGQTFFDLTVGMACTLDVFVFVNDEGATKIDLPSGVATKETGNLDFTCTTDVGVGAAGTAVGGAIVTSSLATATLPVTITTTTPHGLATGNVVTIAGNTGIAANGTAVAGNPVNGQWRITVVTPTTFTLDGSTGTNAAAAAGAGGTTTLDTGSALDMRFDNDCADGTNPALGTDTNGDGVVLFHVLIDTVGASAGDVKTVNVSQEDVAQTFDVNVVGPANNVELTLAEKLVETQKGTDAASHTTCDGIGVTEALDPPISTLAWAVVTDQDNTKLTRVPVFFKVTPPEDSEIAIFGEGDGPEEISGGTFFSIDPATAGAPTASYQVICGGKESGTATIDASINLISCALTGCTILSSKDHSTADLTVGGPPSSNVLTAEASAIKCDGSEKSTVTAKVTDSAGNNVADGVPVNFSVVALGTANPINTTTKDGVATSVITPLSNSSAGVTVIVTAGDSDIATPVQTSVRVDCALPLATQPVAVPTARGGIAGPDTGNGGYLGQSDSSGFPMWTLIALALGSMTLVAGGVVARRAGK